MRHHLTSVEGFCLSKGKMDPSLVNLGLSHPQSQWTPKVKRTRNASWSWWLERRDRVSKIPHLSIGIAAAQGSTDQDIFATNPARTPRWMQSGHRDLDGFGVCICWRNLRPLPPTIFQGFSLLPVGKLKRLLVRGFNYWVHVHRFILFRDSVIFKWRLYMNIIWPNIYYT